MNESNVYLTQMLAKEACAVLSVTFHKALFQDHYYFNFKTRPVMFVDDTNLFLFNKDINKPFNDMNVELQIMSIWFKANKLSLILPILYIDNFEILRESVTKFLLF